MASLMEELLSTMESEKEQYLRLIDLSDDKKDSIIHGKPEVLESISAVEQEIGDRLKELEHKRVGILKDMAIVTGHDGETITVSWMIDNLSGQPAEQEALSKARNELIEVAGKLQFLNEQNQILLKQAMDMVEFDLTLFKSLKQAPETANYNRKAYNTGDILGSSGFDAKQ